MTIRVRIAYAFDRGRHRQTGETGFLQINGEPFDVFPVNDPIAAGNGDILEKRDRLSIALLHQVSGEYRGEFFDGRLTVNAGLRVPFFTRDLTTILRDVERERVRRMLRHQYGRPGRLSGE